MRLRSNSRRGRRRRSFLKNGSNRLYQRRTDREAKGIRKLVHLVEQAVKLDRDAGMATDYLSDHQ